MSDPDPDTYALRSGTLAEVPAPDLPYLPPAPVPIAPGSG